MNGSCNFAKNRYDPHNIPKGKPKTEEIKKPKKIGKINVINVLNRSGNFFLILKNILMIQTFTYINDKSTNVMNMLTLILHVVYKLT